MSQPGQQLVVPKGELGREETREQRLTLVVEGQAALQAGHVRRQGPECRHRTAQLQVLRLVFGVEDDDVLAVRLVQADVERTRFGTGMTGRQRDHPDVAGQRVRAGGAQRSLVVGADQEQDLEAGRRVVHELEALDEQRQHPFLSVQGHQDGVERQVVSRRRHGAHGLAAERALAAHEQPDLVQAGREVESRDQAETGDERGVRVGHEQRRADQRQHRQGAALSLGDHHARTIAGRAPACPVLAEQPRQQAVGRRQARARPGPLAFPQRDLGMHPVPRARRRRGVGVRRAARPERDARAGHRNRGVRRCSVAAAIAIAVAVAERDPRWRCDRVGDRRDGAVRPQWDAGRRHGARRQRGWL